MKIVINFILKVGAVLYALLTFGHILLSLTRGFLGFPPSYTPADDMTIVVYFLLTQILWSQSESKS